MAIAAQRGYQATSVFAPEVIFSVTNLGESRRGSSERSEGRLDAVLGASFSMISQLRIIGIIAWPPESSSENPQYS